MSRSAPLRVSCHATMAPPAPSDTVTGLFWTFGAVHTGRLITGLLGHAAIAGDANTAMNNAIAHRRVENGMVASMLRAGKPANAVGVDGSHSQSMRSITLASKGFLRGLVYIPRPHAGLASQPPLSRLPVHLNNVVSITSSARPPAASSPAPMPNRDA